MRSSGGVFPPFPAAPGRSPDSCRRRWPALLAAAAVLLGWTAAEAAFFKYTDRQGRTHYVDEIWKVPPEYRGQVGRIAERYDHLPEEVKAQAIEEERKRQTALEIERQRLTEQQIKEFAEREAAENRQRTDHDRRRALAGMETRVAIVNNQILVPVTFAHQGRELATQLILDTGASHTVLHRATAAPLNIITLAKGRSTVAGGQTVATELCRVDVMRIGPIEARDVHVTVIAFEGPRPPYGGLLGMDFLSQVEYTIDYANQVVRWKLRE
jgi:hypothetical protein